MSKGNKLAALVGALFCYVLIAADWLDKAKKLYDAPSTALTFWGVLHRLWSDITPIAWMVLGLGTACLLVATSDWWRPWIATIRAAMNDKGASPVDGQPPAPTGTVSLVEAATQAYEAARERKKLSAQFAEVDWKDKAGGRLQDEILTWYCWALGDRIDIYGNFPPSRQPEKIDWSVCKKTHQFELFDDNLIFKDRSSRGYFENLHVKAVELPAALQKVDAMG